MIYFYGDLSKQDAEILKNLALKSHSILEFGVGGSTQILRHYAPEGAYMMSVETAQEWIAKTKANLQRLNISVPVKFEDYYVFMAIEDQHHTQQYDLIFDDGAMEFRLPFALKFWRNLKIGGVLVFHDARTSQVIDHLIEFIKKHSPEIESVVINANHSNMAIITKKDAEFYENWNEVEGKTKEQSGYN